MVKILPVLAFGRVGNVFEHVCSFLRTFCGQIVKPTTFIFKINETTTFANWLCIGRGTCAPAPKSPKFLLRRSSALCDVREVLLSENACICT